MKIEKNKICLKNIEHIIWDYNGTLLNDVDLCVDVINIVLNRRDLKIISKSEYQTAFDFPVKDYYEKIGFDFNKESFEIVGTEFINEYNKQSDKYILHEYSRRTLDSISNLGIGQSVLSARLKDSLVAELADFGIDNSFDYVYGLNDHYANGKHEIGKLLIEKISLPADRILFIGDTLHDMELARALGCQELLIAGGHHTFEHLSEYSDNVIHSMSDLYSIIENGNCLEFKKKETQF